MKNEDSSQPLFLFCFHSLLHSSLSLFFPLPTSFSHIQHSAVLAISLMLLYLRWPSPSCQSQPIPPLLSSHSSPLFHHSFSPFLSFLLSLPHSSSSFLIPPLSSIHSSSPFLSFLLSHPSIPPLPSSHSSPIFHPFFLPSIPPLSSSR